MVVVVVVVWLIYYKRMFIVRGADLSEKNVVDVRGYNLCFCFTSKDICHFSSEKGETPKGLLIFFWKKTESENKIMEIVEDFVRGAGRFPPGSSSNKSKNTASPAALDFCLPGPSSVPVGRSTVLQRHCDAQLLVSLARALASLSSPPCGAVIAMHHVDHWA